MMLASQSAGTGRSTHLFLGLMLLLISGLFGSRAEAQNVTVNPGAGSYVDLKSAFDAINAGTHTGAVTVSIVADTTEAAPAVLNASGAGAALYTSIAITPSGARTISGAIVAGSPLIDLNGADNVTIDGLNSAGNSLTIANTTVSATAGTSTIRFINDASSNTIQNATINGAATAATSGTIFFSNTTGTTGNDNNTVTACNVGSVAATFPTVGILSSGTTTSQTTRNSGNQITNNNIFDFFNSGGVVSNGILASGSTDWTITGNSFYQTAPRTMAAGSGFIAVSIADTSGINFLISNNFIGGSAASAGGAAWTQTGATTHTFIGIRLSVGTATPSSLQNNTIRNIAISTSSTSTINAGIAAVTGSMNIGTVAGNTIGSSGSTGSITWTGAGTGAGLTGILAGTGTAGVIAISNNTIGGIAVAGTGTTAFRAINTQLGATSYTVSGNTIGSTTIANSISNSTNQIVAGIASSSSSTSVTIANNTIANLTTTGTSTANLMIGILTSGGINTITGNTIRNFTSSGVATGATGSPSFGGIIMSSALAGQTIARNTIHSASNSAATAAVSLTGIFWNNSSNSAATNIVERNFVHSLSTSSTGAAIINGIFTFNGGGTYRNNMVRVGIDAAGNSLTSAALIINGIQSDTLTTATNNWYFNSVFVGGAGVNTGSATSAVFKRVTSDTMDFRNNIMVNNRSNGTGTGKHYVMNMNTMTTVTSNANNFHGTGTGAVFGVVVAVDSATFAAWQTATSQDAASFFSDPMFLTPTGTAATVDLHIDPSVTTLIEGNGVPIAAPTDDFDGQPRVSLTPVDIGADAGNFMGIDLAPPSISYVALGNTSLTTNRTLSATITDVSGVATGGLAPRIYYRKNAGSYFSQACTLSGGTVNNGTWSCIINNADVGGVVVADAIFYFVVAQDVNGNLGSFPGGAIGADVNTITTPPSAPSTYTIRAAAVGLINVGPTETITSLTNAGGIFEALNASVFTGNVVINITGDLTAETGAVALNQWSEDGVGGYTLLIRPSGAARAISSTATATAVIKLSDADNVTIDGSLSGGNDRSLTITNTNAAASTAAIWVASAANGASNNTIKNVNLVGGADQSLATVFNFGIISSSSAAILTGGADNDNNTYSNNFVKKVAVGIISIGGTAANPYQGTTITNNLIGPTAFGVDQISLAGVLVFNENLTNIIGNEIRFVGDAATAGGSSGRDHVGIVLGSTGAAWSTTGAGTSVAVTNANVSRNLIHDIVELGTFSAVGITVNGSNAGNPTLNTIANNMIYNVFANGTSGDQAVGIGIASGNGDKVVFNSVFLSGDIDPGAATAASTPAFGISVATSTPTNLTLRDNISVMDLNSNTVTLFHSAVNVVATTYPWGTGGSDFNDWFAPAANLQARVGSTAAGGVFYSTLGAWQAAVTQDASSQSVDPLFVSNSDLHLQATSPAQDIGTPIGGVTVDFDGNSRSVTTPDIGADEFVSPNTPPSITPTAGGIARTQGSAASNSQIAVVSDTETAAGSLVVTTQGALPVGISVSNIANSAGNITADVAASCLAATGANLVALRVTDAGTLFTDANLTVDVAANTAPVLGTYPASNATTGIGTTVTPNAAPSDNGSIASITASAPGFTGSFSVDTGTGVVTVTNPGPANIYTVTVTATDDCGTQTTATFQLSVSDSNAAPAITPAAALTRQRGSAASNSALATVTDDTPAQNVVVTAQTVPAGLTVTGIVNTAGAITGNVAASCTATLGSNTVVLRATDPGTLFTDGNLTVDVTANTAVVQGIYPATSVNAGAGTTVTPDAAPTDNGSISSITAAAPGFTGSFSVNTSTGVVTVTNAGPGGVFTVTVTATDNCGTTSTRTFSLTVNALPNIVAASVTPKAGDAASVRTIANVSDNEDAENTLAVTIDGGATATSNGVTVGSIAVDTGGIVTANVLASCGATNASFTLRVTDSGSLFRETTLNTVVTANTAPLLSYGTTMLSEGSGAVVGPSAGPTDSGSITSIVVQSAGTYTGGVTVAPTGNVTLTNAAPDGSHTLTIRATDNCGVTTDAALLVNVLGDALFANGFEDIVRTPAKMTLPLGAEGVLQTLVLPTFELQDIAAGGEVVDVIEFAIGNTRSLLQVRGATGYLEARLLDSDGRGGVRTGAWMEMSGQVVLQLQWRARTVEGELQVETALTVVAD
jgi:trimeric autotransporter adhesin